MIIKNLESHWILKRFVVVMNNTIDNEKVVPHTPTFPPPMFESLMKSSMILYLSFNNIFIRRLRYLLITNIPLWFSIKYSGALSRLSSPLSSLHCSILLGHLKTLCALHTILMSSSNMVNHVKSTPTVFLIQLDQARKFHE